MPDGQLAYVPQPCLATFFYSEVACEDVKRMGSRRLFGFLTSSVLASRGKAKRKAASPPILSQAQKRFRQLRTLL